MMRQLAKCECVRWPNCLRPDNYGKDELNMALEYALDINAYTTKSIESILSKKLYMHKVPNVAINNSILNTHENLRGKDYYQ